MEITKKKLLVVIVLDNTGSMQSIKDRTISGYNEYVQSLYSGGKSTHLTLVEFNSTAIETICDDVPVKDAILLTANNYMPINNTPLYDAVGKTITDIEAAQKSSKVGQDVLFVVITDGEENSSAQYTHEQVMKLIQSKEKDGWTFAYLGANQDSWKAAHNLGYGHIGNVMAFAATPSGVQSAWSTLGNSTHDYFTDRHTYYMSARAPDDNYGTQTFFQNTVIQKTKKKGGDKNNAKS